MTVHMYVVKLILRFNRWKKHIRDLTGSLYTRKGTKLKWRKTNYIDKHNQRSNSSNNAKLIHRYCNFRIYQINQVPEIHQNVYAKQSNIHVVIDQ